MEKLQIYEIIEKQWPLKQGMRVERFFQDKLEILIFLHHISTATIKQNFFSNIISFFSLIFKKDLSFSSLSWHHSLQITVNRFSIPLTHQLNHLSTSEYHIYLHKITQKYVISNKTMKTIILDYRFICSNPVILCTKYTPALSKR